MSQNYTILVNFESESDADGALGHIAHAFGKQCFAGQDVGADAQEEFNNVMYDYCLSGVYRTPQEHWEGLLKPALKGLKPASIEFCILTASGLEVMETIKP